MNVTVESNIQREPVTINIVVKRHRYRSQSTTDKFIPIKREAAI